MVTFLNTLSEDDANLCVLVLTASGIHSVAEQAAGGWKILIRAEDYGAAISEISTYWKENPPNSAITTGFGDESEDGWHAGLVSAGILALFYMVVDMHPSASEIFSLYRASAGDMVGGDLYRGVTALMLHSDLRHLFGNMVGLGVFASAVFSLSGTGVGGLMILVTGVVGNLINAWFYGRLHYSVGASTAVFGAVGILVAIQAVIRLRNSGQGRSPLIPLGGGLALLGFLGAGGPGVDLMAHFFGFAVGLAVGVGYTLLNARQPGQRIQRLCLALTVGLVAAGWLRMF